MDYFDVGNIVNTHGIKGEVRVISITNIPDDRYYTGSPLTWFSKQDETEELIVRSHRKHKNFDLLTFEGYDNINDIEHLVGGTLRVSEENLLTLPEDEFYYHDIIGCDVVEDNGTPVGKVKDILSLGSNDVWVVERERKEDLLLPNISSVVLNTDIDKQIVTIHMMEGLDE